ncbi:MAG: hypothetical protein PHS48_02390 [Bacteroidales bacterium]|nr:hypothetical protein [Bacteroidales bacterium]
MKRLASLLTMMLITFSAFAGNYQNFKVSVYTRAYEVQKMKDPKWLDSTWNIISSQAKIDRIYLETHRDLIIVDDATLEAAKKFFKSKGVETAGGITYTVNESNNFETFCYTNPEHRKKVQEIAEHTAKHFDFFILDDFFFTTCKCDLCIKAKGDMSWTEYRTKLMTEAGKNLVIDPAHKVNPNVKVIIKYPNWYDHFQGAGFDLEHGPLMFDGVWTGTETRDPSGDQHLQNYLGYNIIRYFNNLRPGFNYGGWVDSGGIGMGMDRYVEQLWLTMFAKAPEMSLFDYRQLIGTTLRDSYKTPWQGMGTSFDWNEMSQSIKQKDGSMVKPTTLARAVGVTFDALDKFIGKLGKPVGIKSYKPFHSNGEDFLPNYLGMIGLPMDMYSTFPTDQKVVLLTEQAKYDKDLISKVKAQLSKGGDVVITSGLLKAMQKEFFDIAEIRCTDLKAIVNDFGRYGTSDKNILIPQVLYYTNDAWATASAGYPLTNGVINFPMMVRAPYSKGNLIVLTIPDSMGDLYDLPDQLLNTIRTTLSKDLNVRIEGPSKVGLFVYDNNTFIVESFLDEPVTIKVVTGENVNQLKNLVDNSVVTVPVSFGNAGMGGANPMMMFMRRGMTPSKSFEVTLMPHSYKVFQIE